jgi:hypothetical protein
MRPRLLFALFGTLPLLLGSTLSSTLNSALGSAAAASTTAPQQLAARWLSGQLHRAVEPSQILVSPQATDFESCAIVHARRAPTGATALSLRCPTLALPQLLLLHPSLDAASLDAAALGAGWLSHITPQGESRSSSREASNSQAGSNRLAPGLSHPGLSHPGLSPKPLSIVRAGATLRADWRTDSLHAQFPVVALDSGAASAEIRVRITNTNRILRARILSAQAVVIVART